MNNIRTADAIRPKSFDDIVGQEHLFGERGVVRRMINAGRLTNMIFYGPPGTPAFGISLFAPFCAIPDMPFIN